MALLVSPDGFVLGIEKEKDLAEASIDNIRNGNPEIRPEVWKIMAGDALAPGAEQHRYLLSCHSASPHGCNLLQSLL